MLTWGRQHRSCREGETGAAPTGSWTIAWAQARQQGPREIHRRPEREGAYALRRRGSSEAAVEVGPVHRRGKAPILSNVYLHYVLDLWFEKKLKKSLKGYAELIRYADDFVICCQYGWEAERILTELKERLATFGLTIAEEKTHIRTFGRFAYDQAKKAGRGADPVEFLGFTHYGITGNYRSIDSYYKRTLMLTYRWWNARSQRGSGTWEDFWRRLELFPLPKPRLVHSWARSSCW